MPRASPIPACTYSFVRTKRRLLIVLANPVLTNHSRLFLLADHRTQPNPTNQSNSLESLYKVRKKEGAKTGLRPPSYTDRVLVHSLPDERRRLRLRAVRLLPDEWLNE